MQVKSESISHMGQFAGSRQDCFLSIAHVPDSFSLETAGHEDLTDTQAGSARQTLCFAVFSGSGDAAASKTATRMISEGLEKETERLTLLPLTDIEPFFRRFAEQMNHRLEQAAQDNPPITNIRLSSACLCLHGNQGIVFGIGDCVTYLYRQGQLQLLKPGRPLSAARVGESGKLGCSATDPFPLQAQDRLLLCSRPLADWVDDPAIRTCMDQPDLHQAVRKLRDEYLSRSGPANLTITLLSLTEPAPVQAATAPIQAAGPQTAHPHMEHQSHVYSVKKEKKAIPEQPGIGHTFFWQIIPVWLQFLSMITILLLLVLLAWLLFPRIF